MLLSKITSLLCAALVSAGTTLLITPAYSAPGIAPAAQAGDVPDINTLEKRFFSRTYEIDPLDKRLQRLELMLFGATQSGGLAERIQRIQESSSERGQPTRGGQTVNKQNNDIAALEKKMLKKSFADETAPQRLSRLESKVFGQPTNGMSTPDRIDRLKKIAGVTSPPEISEFPDRVEGNRMDGNSMPFGMPFQFNYNSPFGSSRPDFPQMPQMDDMFKQLNKDLRGLHRMPDGMPNYGSPDAVPFMPRMPNVTPRPADTGLPPYLDPNSI
jgi:hypothetical protein